MKWICLIAILAMAAFFALRQKEPAPLPDGQHLGFISQTEEKAVSFDPAVWLSGKEGEGAAISAGLCTEETRDECLPNDYFILNAEKEDVRLPLSPGAEIFMQTWDMEQTGSVTEQPLSLQKFREILDDGSLHWNQLPYRITVREGKVTRVEEIYVP